jgi:hypothetical protein
MKKFILAATTFGILSACVSPPASPEERVARQAAQARVVASECTIYVGGVSGIREIQQYANRTEEKARKMGADNALISKAMMDAKSTFGYIVALTTQAEACSDWLNDVVSEMG